MRPSPILRLLVLLMAAIAAATGCGEKVVGGRGELVPGAAGQPSLLVLEGAPYQLGWWQGRLLRDEIRALHEPWQDAAIRSQVGLAHDLQRGAAGDLQKTVGYFVDQTLHALPEAVRLELQGIADATDLSVETLLFTEVMRDGLRIWLKRMEPRLPGVLAAASRPAGPEARATWWGPDADLLAGRWIVVERRPLGGPTSAVLSWPGSVGGVAGVSSTGLAYLLGEADVDGEFRGFGHGIPFPVGARLAIEGNSDSARMRGALKGTAGHTLLVLAGPEADGFDGRTAIGSVEIYRGMQPELAFTDGRRAFALGPWQDVFAAHRKLDVDRASADLFEPARTLVPNDTALVEATIFRQGGSVRLVVRDGAGAPREVALP